MYIMTRIEYVMRCILSYLGTHFPSGMNQMSGGIEGCLKLLEAKAEDLTSSGEYI